jgi:hypothetical protein
MAITTSDLKVASTAYINKDFQKLYPEFVKLCQELTPFWNPEASNESDPGVVILKLIAFLGDK